jgi:hypothetical protein
LHLSLSLPLPLARGVARDRLEDRDEVLVHVVRHIPAVCARERSEDVVLGDKGIEGDILRWTSVQHCPQRRKQ